MFHNVYLDMADKDASERTVADLYIRGVEAGGTPLTSRQVEIVVSLDSLPSRPSFFDSTMESELPAFFSEIGHDVEVSTELPVGKGPMAGGVVASYAVQPDSRSTRRSEIKSISQDELTEMKEFIETNTGEEVKDINFVVSSRGPFTSLRDRISDMLQR